MRHLPKSINNCNRLRYLKVLLSTGPRTTLELIEKTKSCNINADISDLRAMGFATKAKMIGKTSAGRKVHARYIPEHEPLLAQLIFDGHRLINKEYNPAEFCL